MCNYLEFWAVVQEEMLFSRFCTDFKFCTFHACLIANLKKSCSFQIFIIEDLT